MPGFAGDYRGHQHCRGVAAQSAQHTCRRRLRIFIFVRLTRHSARVGVVMHVLACGILHGNRRHVACSAVKQQLSLNELGRQRYAEHCDDDQAAECKELGPECHYSQGNSAVAAMKCRKQSRLPRSDPEACVTTRGKEVLEVREFQESTGV